MRFFCIPFQMHKEFYVVYSRSYSVLGSCDDGIDLVPDVVPEFSERLAEGTQMSVAAHQVVPIIVSRRL